MKKRVSFIKGFPLRVIVFESEIGIKIKNERDIIIIFFIRTNQISYLFKYIGRVTKFYTHLVEELSYNFIS